MNPRPADEAAALLLALRFLTRLPVGGAVFTPARMAAATGYLPAAGMLIGLFAAAVFLAAHRVFPPVVALLLATAATSLLTGALHEDGLADTADGLGGGATRERALEIMRDGRIGAYGALALGLTLALRVAALAAMPVGLAATALVAGHGASRASAVLVIATSRYARPDGAGAFTAGGIAPARLGLALATAALCLVAPRRGGRLAAGARRGAGAGRGARGDPARLRAQARRLHRRLPGRDPAGERGGDLSRGARVSLILIRHTRPEVAAGICYGSTDLPAAPGFEAEAAHLTARFPTADRIVSSPLRRCLPLAEFLAERLGAPLFLDARWREMDFGAWEGRAWETIARTRSRRLGGRPHGGAPARRRERRDALRPHRRGDLRMPRDRGAHPRHHPRRPDARGPRRLEPRHRLRRGDRAVTPHTVAGHFGELLQGRLGPDGPLALVTLPTRAFQVTARLHPGGVFRLHVPGPSPLSRQDAATLHRAIANAPPRGSLTLRATMPPGGGAGASTASLLAAAAAFAAAAGRPLPPPAELARICHGIEGATDPLMHPDPGAILWAPRAGSPLAALPPLPEFDVVGGFLGPGRRTDPADLDFADIADLAAAWPPAACQRDLATLAALATESARRNARAEAQTSPRSSPRQNATMRWGSSPPTPARRSASSSHPAAAPPTPPSPTLRALGLTQVARFRAGGSR